MSLNDAGKIAALQRGEINYEPGLGGLLAPDGYAGQQDFTPDLTVQMTEAERPLIAVGSSRRGDGHPDYVHAAEREVIPPGSSALSIQVFRKSGIFGRTGAPRIVMMKAMHHEVA